METSSQLLARPAHPGLLQTLLAVDQHAPALAPPATVAGNDGLEVLARVVEHGIVKGARLQPDGGHAGRVGVLEHLARHGGRRDDGQRRLRGRGQGRWRRDGVVRRRE